MEESNSSENLFILTKKSTGRITHNCSCGEYSFYRRVVKDTGYAIFSCKHKDCSAKISCRYTSKEAASTEEEPTVIRLVVVIHLTYHR